jgi:hypothetical protein
MKLNAKNLAIATAAIKGPSKNSLADRPELRGKPLEQAWKAADDAFDNAVNCHADWQDASKAFRAAIEALKSGGIKETSIYRKYQVRLAKLGMNEKTISRFLNDCGLRMRKERSNKGKSLNGKGPDLEKVTKKAQEVLSSLYYEEAALVLEKLAAWLETWGTED